MKRSLINIITKKIIEFIMYGPGYKAPEYAYVRLTQPSDKNKYNNTF